MNRHSKTWFCSLFCFCSIVILVLYSSSVATPSEHSEKSSVITPGAVLTKLSGGYGFTEGPAVDNGGNIFFIDIPPDRIYTWSTDGTVTLFMDHVPGGANGLYCGKDDIIFACAFRTGKVISIDRNKSVTVIAESFENEPFRSPNDLWIDNKGGIYFTDPHLKPEDGRYVYYILPDRSAIKLLTEVPYMANGLVGSPDGKTLYIIEYHAGRTYAHSINDDGSVSRGRLFAPCGEDGLTVDCIGNVYITTRHKSIAVYSPDGTALDTIDLPEEPSNLCFGGEDRKTLFITAKTSLYSLKMQVSGVR